MELATEFVRSPEIWNFLQNSQDVQVSRSAHLYSSLRMRALQRIARRHRAGIDRICASAQPPSSDELDALIDQSLLDGLVKQADSNVAAERGDRDADGSDATEFTFQSMVRQLFEWVREKASSVVEFFEGKLWRAPRLLLSHLRQSCGAV